MQFTDAVTISGVRTRDDGYLVADAKVARTGIQRYLGSEVGRPDIPFVDVFRPESEVFKDTTLASFAHRPVTNDHPPEAVTADNWSKYARGQTDGEIKRDGDFIRVPLMVADAAAIKQIDGGKRELSAGYTCDLKWEAGSYNGTKYDAIQTNIRANHIAIVQRGRAGKDCRIGDSESSSWGIAPITTAQDKEPDMGTRTIMVDGLSVETTDAGAQAIEKLTKDRDAANQLLADSKKTQAEELKKKDDEIAKKDAAIDDLKSKVLDTAAVSKLVADRVALEATALKIAKDVKPTGLTDSELKLAVVKAKLGDALTADKAGNAAYIDARFDILAEDAGKVPDTFRDARLGLPTQPQNMSDAEAARQKAFADLLHYDQYGQEQKAN